MKRWRQCFGWACAVCSTAGCGSAGTDGAEIIEDQVGPNEAPPVGVGDPCVPDLEYDPQFSGFWDEEITIEAGHEQCQTGLCLVNHFQGRVSCVYGQTAADIGLGDPDDPTDDDPAVLSAAGDWAGRCAVPLTSGERPEDRVQVPVWPQKVARLARDTVYCSCRCANSDGESDDGGNYCACPSNYDCVQLTYDLELGGSDLAGFYCIKSGTEYNASEAQVSPECRPDLDLSGSRYPDSCE